MKRFDGAVAENIKYSHLVSVSPQKIVVGFTKDRKFYFDHLSKIENKDKIISVLNELVTPAPVLEFVIEKDSNNIALIDKINTELEYHNRMAKKTVIEHPFINSIIKDMNAVVEDITNLDDKKDV